MTGGLMIVAGEPSGDTIAAHALRELKPLVSQDLPVFGVGGDELAAAGMDLCHHYRDIAVMGVADVIRTLGRVLGAIRQVEALARERKPDVLLLVDFPGFNLRLAKRLHGIVPRVVYYISPKYWAWKRNRLHSVIRHTDCQLLIFPFEEADYRKLGAPAEYVGHPVLDLVQQAPVHSDARLKLGLRPDQPAVALFPGSRSGELKRHLPVLQQCVTMLEDMELQLILQLPAGVDKTTAEDAEYRFRACRVIRGEVYTVLSAVDVALVASGTLSLEAAALGLPHLVYYKIDRLAWQLAKLFVRLRYVSPANIVAERELVPEFLQDDASPTRMANWVLKRLQQWNPAPGVVDASLRDTVTQVLGGPGASKRAAEALFRELKETRNGQS